MNTTLENAVNTQVRFEGPSFNKTGKDARDASPWNQRKAIMYKDMTLKDDYLCRKMRFAEGDNWVRVVPALSGSKHEWMMAIHALEFEGGRFAHPKTLLPGAKCAYDTAYEWAKQNCPQGLYSKANKGGVRLLSDPLALCYILAEENGKQVVRVLLASGYDGRRGGTAGLGFRLWKAVLDHDTSKSAVPDAVNPATGVKVCINKRTVKGNPRPIYTVSLGRQPSPIMPLIEELSSEEKACLISLESIVRILSKEQEWECLSKLMSPNIVESIREDAV